MDRPILSVVMPVYNGEKYLSEAIDSVLNQTFNDLELLIINDGSTDSSLQIIQSYNNEKIVLINNKKNYGIPYCRNLGLKKARGEYLTWTDCDDINEPTRFEEQIKFLNTNKEFGVCGTSLVRFGKEKYISKIYKDPELVKATLLFKTSIPNATAMLRLSKIKEFDLKYDTQLPITEDYDFIFRCSMHFPLTNIQKVLYRYRASETSIMSKFQSNEINDYNVHKIVYKKILDHLDIKPTESELKIHRAISSGKLFDNIYDYKACYDWLKTLKIKNQKVKLYPYKIFNKVLADQLFFISKKASKFGMQILFFYIKESYMSFRYVSIYKIIKLTIRCMIKYDKFQFNIKNIK